MHQHLESACRRNEIHHIALTGITVARLLTESTVCHESSCSAEALTESTVCHESSCSAEALAASTRCNLRSNAPPIRSFRVMIPATLLALSVTIRCRSPSVRSMTNVRYRENFSGTHGAEWSMYGSCTQKKQSENKFTMQHKDHIYSHTYVCRHCRVAYYQLRHLRPLIRLLSFDAATLLVQAFISTCLDYCNSLLYTVSATICTDAYKPFKMPQHASSPTREGASTSRPSCNSYVDFQSANVFNSRSPCWCTKHCTTSCLRTWRKTANLCLSLDTDDCVCPTPTRAYSTANQHTFWRSLIR